MFENDPTPTPTDIPVEGLSPTPSTPTAPVRSGRGGRRAGVRAAVALVALVVVGSAAFAGARLVATQPTASAGAALAGWAPADSLAYFEAHLDPASDQHAKLATVMARFPGWGGANALDTKIGEIYDRLLAKITKEDHEYTEEIAPWFSGTFSVAVTKLPDASAAAAAAASGAKTLDSAHRGDGLATIGVKDAAAAQAWLTKTVAEYPSITTSTHGTTTLYSTRETSAALLTDVLIIGDTDSVTSAIDGGGKNGLSGDSEFAAAAKTVDQDGLATYYVDVKAYLAWAADLGTKAGGAAECAAQASLAPSWVAGSLKADSDAFVGSMASPHDTKSSVTKNAKSALLAHLPASTLFVADVHDTGARVGDLIEAYKACPEYAAMLKQVESAITGLGGWAGVTGWIGEAALVVDRSGKEPIGGLAIVPKDAAAADKLFVQLKNWVALAGGAVTATDESYGGQTVTVITSPKSDDMQPIAYVVSDQYVALGSEAWVKSVIDTSAGWSLASDARFAGALGRVDAEHTGLVYANVAGLASWIESSIPASAKAKYTQVEPYLDAIDAFIATQTVASDYDRGQSVLIVK